MSNKKKKNIAIIFHGLVHRSLKYTVKSFEKKILRPLQRNYNVDVYHHSWVTEMVYNPRGHENNISIDIDAVKKYMPYSRGVEESQDEFDATIDKSFFNAKNPMRPCNKTVEGAYITAMNSLRDLESTKRAFDYMNTHKKMNYDFVMVCRPDVEFLNKFRIQKVEKLCRAGRICVPCFDSCRGINDRFALGGYEDMRTYCNRTEGALDWMIHGTAETSEGYLKKYLVQKNIEIEPVRIFFRRIRANGEIFHEDTVLGSKNRLMFIYEPQVLRISNFYLRVKFYVIRKIISIKKRFKAVLVKFNLLSAHD